MIVAYWNALRVGDEVCVHDDREPKFAISNGTVSSVDSRSDSNAVTVRMTDGGDVGHLIRPKRHAVHLPEGDTRVDCWRCGIR